MKVLFERIEALIRGEYNLEGEGLLEAAADLECATSEAEEELRKIGDDFADMLIEEIIEAGEDCEDGTPEEGAEYVRRIKELYKQAKTMM